MKSEPEATEVTYALGRLPGRTYVSRTFRLDLRNSQDFGQPARYVTKVFDEGPRLPEDAPGIERSETVLTSTPGGRKQVKFQVARETGSVREIQIQKVPTNPAASRMDVLLALNRDESRRLIELVRALDYIPVDDSDTVRIDDELLREIFRDPAAIDQLYGRDPDRIRSLIEADASARDVIAVAHRHAVIERFRELLTDEAAFEDARRECGGGSEEVWQRFLEENPWILGISLSGQLLTSWNESRLEQTVAGFAVERAGKRVDALLRTNGQIRSLVFAEVKHHRTALLASRPYRPSCWSPSTELSGGVAQAQLTVDRAVRDLGDRLIHKDEEGTELGDEAFLVRPRSFLLVGDLGEFISDAGRVNPDKYRSFELYRRHLVEPEVITFDELLARAEWHVSISDADT
jgi:hypothetical protein